MNRPKHLVPNAPIRHIALHFTMRERRGEIQRPQPCARAPLLPSCPRNGKVKRGRHHPRLPNVEQVLRQSALGHRVAALRLSRGSGAGGFAHLPRRAAVSCGLAQSNMTGLGMRRKVGGAEWTWYDGKRVLDTNGATRALFWRLVAVAFQRVVAAVLSQYVV